MVKVGCIQLWHNDEDTKQDRIACAERLIDSAADCDLIVLAELWNTGVWSYDIYHEFSEPIQGETVNRIAEKARKVNAYIFAGSIIERDGDKLYNTAVMLDPKGKLIATYRKIHLFGSFGSKETELMTPGKELVSIKTDVGVLGLSICYDLRFPELFRKLAAHHGVEIILHATAWPLARLDDYRDTCHVRANENQCYLVTCASAGFNMGNPFSGHSAIIDPWGIRLGSTGLYESVPKAEIEISEIYKIREMLPLHKDRVFPV
ncbi:nitrilase-related carbon-nitrogen hydrolase [Chloroflexota bacterium]